MEGFPTAGKGAEARQSVRDSAKTGGRENGGKEKASKEGSSEKEEVDPQVDRGLTLWLGELRFA